MAFNVKELLDQLDRGYIPVKCGEEFDLVVEYSVIVGQCNKLSEKEERQMYRGLQAEWMKKARAECGLVGASCPNPIQGGGTLLESKCEKKIWTIKMLVKTKCKP